MKSTYSIVKSMRAPWLSEVSTIVKAYIKSASEELKREAEYEDMTELLDENKLYEHFKENCDHCMYNANWQILKYFIRILRIKVYKEMLGEVTYTKKDKEMYEYFNTIKVNAETKCKASQLRFNGGVETDYNTLIYGNYPYDKFRIFYEYKDNGRDMRGSIDYFSCFKGLFRSIENMARNAKMLQNNEIIDLFNDASHVDFKKLYGNNVTNVSLINREVAEDEERKVFLTFYSQYNEVLEKNETIRALSKRLKEECAKEMTAFCKVNKVLYKKLSDEHKKYIEKIKEGV